jgi:hypothetical protein
MWIILELFNDTLRKSQVTLVLEKWNSYQTPDLCVVISIYFQEGAGYRNPCNNRVGGIWFQSLTKPNIPRVY